jgi:carboxylesterase type B
VHRAIAEKGEIFANPLVIFSEICYSDHIWTPRDSAEGARASSAPLPVQIHKGSFWGGTPIQQKKDTLDYAINALCVLVK